jgi:hypothetical protein
MARSLSANGGSGKFGTLRTPYVHGGNVGQGKTLRPKIAGNVNRPGISRRTAPIQTPFNKGGIV